MANRKKTTSEKMDRPAELVDMPAKWLARLGPGKLLIPAPRDVEALVRKIPKGRVATQASLREELARAAGAQSACPICTGIFLGLAAKASEEDAAAGKTRVTPWWRVVRNDGKLWDKSPAASRSRRAGCVPRASNWAMLR